MSSSCTSRSLRETAAAFTNWGRLPMIVTIRTDIRDRTYDGGDMGRRLLQGASVAIGLAGDAVRHIAWYLAHRIGGRPREMTEQDSSLRSTP
jgi:hypothetical protein